MPISPHQVTSNANGKVLAIERIVNDRAMPGPEQMRQITALCDDFRAAVAGSTADPFRTGMAEGRAVRTDPTAGMCRCDGEPHNYVPETGWCPADGPVTHP